MSKVNMASYQESAVDIEAFTKRRVDALRKERRDISLDHMVHDGEYGKWSVILYIEYNFNPMGFEFIESATSWKRPEAIQYYNELVEGGYCVMVYVSERVLDKVSSC